MSFELVILLAIVIPLCAGGLAIELLLGKLRGNVAWTWKRLLAVEAAVAFVALASYLLAAHLGSRG
jgi:hypothetical protein